MTAAKWILHSPKQAGAPQLQLLTPLADGRQQLLWQYELPQAEDEVVLSAFFNKQCSNFFELLFYTLCQIDLLKMTWVYLFLS